MPYILTKGHEPQLNGKPRRGAKPGKAEDYKFLTQEQVEQLLDAVATDKSNPHRSRDHCALFCGFYFGLRITECTLLERNCFDWLAAGKADIPTLKQKGMRGKIPPRMSPRRIEAPVIEYLLNYASKLPPEQKWLFVGRNIKLHLSSRTLDRVFNTYAQKLRLSIHYSWHSLRHARGVAVYERFKDIKMVQAQLRHKSVKSSDVYTHLSPSRREEEQRTMESNPLNLKPLD